MQHDVRNRGDLLTMVIRLPWSKAAQEKGEEIYWAKQEGIADPHSALANHLKVNNPAPENHLFSYHNKDGPHPMTKHALFCRVHQIARAKKLKKLPGHGIRVGGTLEYLLHGIQFNVVKTMGRWKSDAFKLYLRNHRQIMAPYIQADPKAFENFVVCAMPPVC